MMSLQSRSQEMAAKSLKARREAEKQAAAKPKQRPVMTGGRRGQNWEQRKDGGLTITIRGGANADEGKKPAKAEAAKPASAKPASAKRNKNAEWAAKERETLKQDRITQKARQTANAYESGKRTAKRMESPGAKAKGNLRGRMQQAGENLRKLGAAIKPSKSGVASYKSFMGG